MAVLRNSNIGVLATMGIVGALITVSIGNTSFALPMPTSATSTTALYRGINNGSYSIQTGFDRYTIGGSPDKVATINTLAKNITTNSVELNEKEYNILADNLFDLLGA